MNTIVVITLARYWNLCYTCLHLRVYTRSSFDILSEINVYGSKKLIYKEECYRFQRLVRENLSLLFSNLS